MRIIIDPKLKIPLTAQVLRDSNVLIATTENADSKKLTQIKKSGAGILIFLGPQISIEESLIELAKREIISVLVEGGSMTLGHFADSRLFDIVYAFHAPIIIGGKNAISAVGGEGVETVGRTIKFSEISYKHFGDNLLTIARV